MAGRNGLGTTRELLREPDSDDWHWRLSIATSTGSADFSAYPGFDRELLLLNGDGLELRFADGRTTLLVPGERTRFAGDDAVMGVPLGGPTDQLNLIWRRDVVTDVEPVAVANDSAAFVVRLSSRAAG